MNATIAAPQIIRWEEPAPLRTASRDLAHLADAIRANPGKSAVIAEHPNTKEGRRIVATLIGVVKYKRRGFSDPEGTFHVTTRTERVDDGNDGKVIRVFVRFNAHE
ncbi:hypothetical protein [Streptosporangium sp. NPDC001681]|uniref:hypothetical protein n=1 Tax=Streptosporangium sp. NPDC001681 TaxID=3154395 RepID=UPI00332992EB